jgi:hypothetical protein
MAWSEKHGVSYRIDHVPGTRMTVLNTSIEELDRELASKQAEYGTDEGDSEDLMWTLDEETFVLPTPSLSQRLILTLSGWAPIGGMIVVVVAMLLAVVTKANGMIPGKADGKSDCVFV